MNSITSSAARENRPTIQQSNIVARLSGRALLVGGVMAAIGYAFSSFFADTSSTVTSIPYFITHGAEMLGAFLVVLGVPALLERLSERSIRFGVVGYGATVALVLLHGFFYNALALFAFPVILADADLAARFFTVPLPPASMLFYHVMLLLIQLIGPLLLGIATLRSDGRLPRWPGFFLIVSSLDTLRDFTPLNVPLPILNSLAHIWLFLGLASYGFALLASRRNEAMLSAQPTIAQPERAR